MIKIVILVRSAPQIFFLECCYTFPFSSFVINALRNTSANCPFIKILLLIAGLSHAGKISDCERVTAPPEHSLSKNL